MTIHIRLNRQRGWNLFQGRRRDRIAFGVRYGGMHGIDAGGVPQSDGAVVAGGEAVFTVVREGYGVDWSFVAYEA